MPDLLVMDSKTKNWFRPKKFLKWRYRQWADRLPPGRYQITDWNNHWAVESLPEAGDDAMVPSGKLEKILKEFKDLFSVRDKFESVGMLFKRGFYMWGPPGTGKTTAIRLMANYVIEELGGIVIMASSDLAHQLDVVRALRPAGTDYPLMVIIEDFEAMLGGDSGYNWREKNILALLDGEQQVDNVVFVATSNYPELTNKRIFNRPSRFDVIEEVGPPGPDFRRAFLDRKLGGGEYNIGNLVNLTQGYTVAHLREFVVLVYCLGWTPGDADAKLRKMMEGTPNSENAEGKMKVGF